ncbi:MAG: hypothetical protein KDC38_07440 [Planctomycetes bacterium]|nr:hypothetical protein [Planctomycetota bacterium]
MIGSIRGTFARVATVALLGSSALGISACSNAEVRSRMADLEPRAHVPIDEVRDAFDLAKAESPSLRMGFFRVTWFDDDDEASETTALVDRLQRDVAPESWPRPGRQAFRQDDWLVVFQDKAVLDRIQPWLESYEQEQVETRGLVGVEVHLLRSRAAGSEWSKADHRALSESEVAALLEDPDMEVISAPRVQAVGGQRATITISNERAYIGDVDIYLLDGDYFADPIIETLQEGVFLELVGDRTERGVHLDLDITYAELLSMQQERVRIDETGTDVEIEIPTVDRAQRAIEIEAAPDTPTLVRITPKLLALVRAR